MAFPKATPPAPPPAPDAVTCMIRSAAVRASGTPTRVNKSSIASVGNLYFVPNKLFTEPTIGSPSIPARVAAPAPAIAPGIAPTPPSKAPAAPPAIAPAVGNANPLVIAPDRPVRVVDGSCGCIIVPPNSAIRAFKSTGCWVCSACVSVIGVKYAFNVSS